jgi:hypothetical protein
MSNLRNYQLLQQVKTHPLGKTLAAALDSSEAFEGDAQALSLNQNYSAQGRDNELRKRLRVAIRDNRDARGAMTELQTRLAAKRKAVERPPLDQSQAARDDRREARLILRNMDRGERALLLSGAGADPDFQDAMLEKNPIYSGLLAGEQFLVDAAKEQRLAGLYGPQQAEISELENTIAEANMIFDVALGQLKLHSAMDDRDFNDFVAPIMSRRDAPWLVRHGDGPVMRVRPELAGTPQLHQPATAEEIADGIFFKDEAEFRAARAAA